MAYSWTNNLPDGGALPENSAIAPLATLTASDGGVDAVSYGISDGSDGYGNVLFAIDDNGVLSPTSYLNDYENSLLVQYSADRHFSAVVNAYSAEGDVVVSRIFVLTLQDVNEFATDWVSTPPTGIAINENNPENHKLGDFYAQDGDGSADVTYSLSGDDAAYFTTTPLGGIGLLYLKSSLDYEDSSHADGLYSVIVTATSTDGSPAISQTFILTVTNVADEDAIWVSNPAGIEIAENNPENFGPIAFNATDRDGAAVTYSLEPSTASAPNDAAYFNLDANTGELSVKSVLNFEDPDHGITYSVIINATSTDGSPAISQTFIVTVTDVDEGVEWETNPTGNAGEVLENIAVGTALATFSATDPEGEGSVYGLGAYFPAFGLDGGSQGKYFSMDIYTGVLTTNSELDFENTDIANGYYTLNVLSQASPTEEKPLGTEVISHIFILTLGDVADETLEWVAPPSTEGRELAENNPATTTSIANFGATDTVDDTPLTYSLSGTDSADFAIDAATGELSISASFDFEDSAHANGLYSVIITATATDGTSTPAISRRYVLTITDVNEGVEWQTTPTGNAGVVLENIAIGTSVADFSSTDPEGAIVNGEAVEAYGLGADYGFDGGHQDSYFTIGLRTGVITTKSALDFETQEHYTLLVLSQATDKSLGTEVISELFILTITDQDIEWESGGNPTGNAIAENNPTATLIADFGATDTTDNSTLTYSLAAGGDSANFAIGDATGQLSTRSSFNFEDSHDPRYSVVVIATAIDAAADAVSQTFILTINDVDEQVEWQTAPTGNAGEVLENMAIGTSVANFVSTDPEGAGAYYGLGSDYGFDGGHQDAYFNLNLYTGELITNSELNFEEFTHYTILALSQAAEGNKGVASELFIFTLTNIENEDLKWVSTPSTATSIAENDSTATTIGIFGATDTADGSPLTYSLATGGADNSYFAIDAETGELSTTGVSFNFEGPDHANGLYTAIVNATATEGSTPVLSRRYVLTVTNVDEPVAWQTAPTGNAGEVLENLAIGTSVAAFVSTDPEGTATAYYGLGASYGIGGGHQDEYFNIGFTTGVITTKSELDFEDSDITDGHYTILALSQAGDKDIGVGVISQIFILTINDAGLATPDWASNTSTGKAINENNGTESLFNFNNDGALPSGVSITYGISGENTTYFGIDTSNGWLRVNAGLDYESTYGQSINNRYSVIITANVNVEGTAISRVYILTVNDVDNTTAFSAGGDGVTIAENNVVGFDASDRIDDFGNDNAIVSITYGLSGDSADYFSVAATSGWLFVTSSLDYESTYGQSINNRYSVVITANATEEGNAISRVYILTVNDVDNTNDWASDTTTGKAIDENNGTESLWTFNNDGALPSGVAITYGISGENTTYFDINTSSGLLRVNSSLDYESDYGQSINNRYSVVITADATDEGDAISRVFILTINDVSNTTAFSAGGDGATIAENNVVGFDAGDRIDDFGNDNATAPITYGLSGDAADYFSIAATTGWLFVTSSFDYESTYGQSINNRYSVIVTANATEEGTAISRVYILTIGDVGVSNDWNSNTPTGKAINENNSTGSLWDFDNDGALSNGVAITYGISGENTTYFGIDTSSGLLSVNSGLDYESTYGQSINNRYSVIITANGTGGESAAISRTYILTIDDVSNTPDWASNTPTGVARNENGNNAVLGDFRNDEPLPDGVSLTYGLSGVEAGRFSISPRDGGEFWRLRGGGNYDYESDYGQSINNRYSVIITANVTEEGTAISRVFILTVNDVTYKNGWNSNSSSGHNINENNYPALLLFGGLTHYVDLPPGVAITYGLSGDNASFFTMDSSSGAFKTNHVFDFESEYGQEIHNRYSVIITANATEDSVATSLLYILTINDIFGGLAPDDPLPAPPVGLNGKVLFDGDADNIGGISDGIDNEGLIIIGDDLVATQYSDGAETNLILNNIENFEQSFVGYTDADGNDQNHWFFVRDDATDNTGHIVFDADGLDVNLESLANGGATTTPDQINLLAGLNFGSDGDFAKPDDLDLNLNNNSASALTHDQFLALIGGSNNIDFI